MAIRASNSTVRAIVEDSDSIDFTTFIAVANQLVDEVCLDSGYTDERLTMIETWLAAHFHSVMTPQATDEKVGPISETRDIQTSLHLNSSRWGQTAMILDSAGNLANLSRQVEMGRKTFTAGVTSLATNPNTSTRDALLDD